MTGSGYELFRQRQFQKLWSANLLVNLCLVMLTLGVSWTMTSLTDSPLLVSMVQTVMSLPFVLFAVPVGLAADSMSHRTLLLISQFWMLAVTGLMAVIAVSGGWNFTPRLLLSTLFLLAIGVMLQQSVWKPFVQDRVPPDKLVAAISFNSLSSDIGRAAGPVLGGYLMGFFGTAVVLITSTASQLMMIFALKTLPRDDEPGNGDAGTQARGSLRDGWRELRRSPQLYGTMIRSALLLAPCGGLLGLLPLEAKENIQTGPIGYGGLLAALGIGTAAAGALMPFLRQRVRLNPLAAVCLLVVGLAMIGVSQWDSMLLDAMFLLFFGFAWSLLSVVHQFAVQMAAPDTMRGLMVALYALVLQGSLAVGSFAFGFLAQHIGVSRSILAAGFIVLSGILIARRYPIPG